MKISDFTKHAPAKQFLIGSGLFVASFILISLIIGGVIVPGPLLYDLHFFVYGGLGYIALAMGLFFVIWTRKKLLSLPAAESPNRLWFLLTAGFVAAFVYIGNNLQQNPLLAQSDYVIYVLITHVFFLSIFVTLAFACFSLAFMRSFVQKFRKELMICAGIGVAFYAAMRVVWLSWPILSFGVSRVVYGLLHIVPGNPTLIPPQTLSVSGFTVFIGEACSGVFSIFLFTCLYMLLLALDWDTIHHGKAMFLFVLAVIGLFFVNVLRVYLIILVGVYYDQHFAVNLFHSYVGMVLFLAYFGGFLWLTGDWLKKKGSRY